MWLVIQKKSWISDQAFGNGVFSLGLFLCTLKTSKRTTR